MWCPEMARVFLWHLEKAKGKNIWSQYKELKISLELNVPLMYTYTLELEDGNCG